LRVRVFIDLLRYSRLRIRDAATLARNQLINGKLLLYTQKTGQPVWLPLPGKLAHERDEFNPGKKYFFWSGEGLEKSTVTDCQRSLAKVFKIAGIKGHAHRLRDTFSVNLLQAGVSLESVRSAWTFVNSNHGKTLRVMVCFAAAQVGRVDPTFVDPG
jgi:integrase/recombinase XerD